MAETDDGIEYFHYHDLFTIAHYTESGEWYVRRLIDGRRHNWSWIAPSGELQHHNSTAFRSKEEAEEALQLHLLKIAAL